MEMENHNHSTVGAEAKVSNTKLMVNYIPEVMNRDTMYSLFSVFGKIDSCKLIANRGYGFVEFANSADAEKARAAFNGLMMQDKILKVSFALLNPESKTVVKTDAESNLYISNLPPDMTVDGLNALFLPFGRITNSRVSQGIGFVCFETRPQAEEAIRRLNGCSPVPGAGPMSVKFANKSSSVTQRPPAPPPPAPLRGGGLLPSVPLPPQPLHAYNGLALAPAPLPLPRPLGYGPAYSPPLLPAPGGKALPLLNKGQQRYNPLAQAPMAQHASLATTTVYVYNIGEDTDELSLWQLFGPYGAIDSIKVIKDQETKKNKGFAFVNMREYEEASTAIQALNGYTLNGQVLSVSFKTQKRK